MTQAALWIGIGLAGGFATGLLGLGGSVLFVPLMLALPPALGQGPLPVKLAAAISLVQVVLAAGASLLLHPRTQVNRALNQWMAMIAAAAALTGGLLSAGLPDATLTLLFALATSLATALLLLPRQNPSPVAGGAAMPWWAAIVAALAGLATGLVGAAGGLLLPPFLHHVIRLPGSAADRTAVGVALVGALAALGGKGLTGQVAPGLTAALMLGALPGAWWGGEVSTQLDGRRLRWAGVAVAALASLWMWGEAL